MTYVGNFTLMMLHNSQPLRLATSLMNYASLVQGMSLLRFR